MRLELLEPIAGGTRYHADGYGGRWTNERTGQGMAPSRAPWTDFAEPLRLPRATIDSLLRYNGLARRLALREPYDATREGFTLGPDPAAEELRLHAVRRGALRWIRRGRGWSHAYGGAAILLLVDDGQPFDQPIAWDRIRSLRGARVLTRWELSPLTYDWGRTSYNVGDVETWQCVVGHASFRAHADRVIVIQGEDLPDDVLQRDNGWGGSIFDLCWAELRNYGSALDFLPEFVSLLTQGVFKQKGLASGVLAGKAQQIADRYETLVGGLSVLNALALDADSESYEVIQRPVSGLKEIFEVLVQALVAAGRYPRVIVLGESPGGLHAAADAPEIRAYYDDVSAGQPEHYSPPLDRILRVMELAKEGPTRGQPVERDIEWNPLYQETEEQTVANQLSRAQRRSVDVTGGIVSGAEARRDPEVAELYRLDPSAEAPTSPAQLEEGLPDDAELSPVVAAPLNAIPEGEQLMSAQDAAARLGCTPGTVHRMAAAGRFPAWRIGSRWRYAWSLIHLSVGGGPKPTEPTQVH